jgi:hypothetical protein
MALVTNNMTVARVAMSRSLSIPYYKCYQSDHASSAVRPCPGSLFQSMTAVRLKHVISNVHGTLDVTLIRPALGSKGSLNRGTVTPLESRDQLLRSLE